ncbi:MAG: CPBP family intramembrane metalloprotease [Lachnospiraceae bacterium]|nr:CPBP family intramembrane metalloprotease [Lachnospiraceae bacterium]
MSRKKALALYLLGTLGQIWMICIVVLILRSSGMIVDYTTSVGMVAIGIGGVSSALWGSIIAVKYKKYDLKKILKDFLNVKQKYSSYLFALLFLFLDFFAVVFQGKFLLSSWYIPIVLFFKAIIIGGIEEIGWRYIFQPVLQERRDYITSTIITFVVWGMWHFSYFYIEGTLSQVQGFEFLIGLLVNCFILSALFIKTNSLWICVMTHSLINVLSQLAIDGNQYVSYVCKIIIIVTAIVVSMIQQNKKRVTRQCE